MSQPSGIQKPVGRNGTNQPNDVRIVQRLLNDAISKEPKLKSSQLKELEDDGKCGPLTVGAIEAYQKFVLGWSERLLDGTVEPGKLTWRSLSGNVHHVQQIKMPSQQVGNYMVFRQGNYKGHLGNSTTMTYGRKGCALCTLTMAATYLGVPTPDWPKDQLPKDLTPYIANDILRKAGAYSGGEIIMRAGAKALGMSYDEYGRSKNLVAEDVRRIDSHLQQGKPVAANVDYHGDSAGDHWILVINRNNDGTYRALDPATGGVVFLASGQNQCVNNVRYAKTEDERTGVLFGYVGSGGSANQQKYIVVRFALLSSGGD